MAVPALTANSPAGGSIAWAAFNINYNGQAYAIPAGNTAAMFVWWPYNGGAGGALQASNVQPVLTDDDLLLFINKGGIPVNVQFASLLDGDLLVNGTVAAAALLAGTISTRELGADSVTANAILAGAIGTSELAAGAVTAGTIAAGAITADKLSIGTISDSAVTNPSFEDLSGGMPVGWGFAANGAATVTLNSPSPITGTNAIGLNVTGAGGSAQAGQAVGSRIPVRAGDTWALTVTALASAAVASGLTVAAVFYDGTGAIVSTVNAVASAAVGVASSTFIGQVVAPANAKTMGVSVTYNGAVANVTIDDVNAYKIILSARIADGAITTPKLAAGSITAGQIAAGAIDATKLTATAIDGKTITGASIVAGSFQTADAAFNTASVRLSSGSNEVEFLLSGATVPVATIAVTMGAQGGGDLTIATAHGPWNTVPSIQMDATGFVRITGYDNTGAQGYGIRLFGTTVTDQVTLNASPLTVNHSGANRGININGGNSQAFIDCNNGGPRVAAITSAGNVQGTGAYTNLSDARAKRGIRYLDSRRAIDAVRAMKPASFTYQDDDTGEVHHGFIAQDMQAVIPEAVVPFDEGDDARLGLRLDPIVAQLVLAVQELADRVA